MTIGIRAIGSYVPASSLSNLDRKAAFGIEEDFIDQKLGVRRVSRKAPEEETSTLCIRAFEALRAKAPITAEGLQCLIVCTQNPDGHGIPHTSAVVHGALGAPESCAAFDVSLGCSGYVYCLAIAKSFMAANGMKRGVLFTSDPYSKILDPNDKNTILLFGDAATATLLEDAGHGYGTWHPTHFLFATRGSEGKALNNDDGTLVMNGRAVFTFSATAVPEQVEALLAQAGVGKDSVDLYLFHQGSRYIVDTLTKRLGLPAQKVPCNLAEQGNTVSSSLPLLLERYLDDFGLVRILLSGFGVGLSWASCLLERLPHPDSARDHA